MSKKLQVGSEIFEIPVNGENPGWGEDTTGWMEAVTDSLKEVQGPNDVSITASPLANNQTTFQDIIGLKFDTSEVIYINIEYFVKREYDSGTSVVTESGIILGNFDGANFYISREQVGDSGLSIDVTQTGQFQYTSSDLPNHVSSVIKFKGKTIDL